MMLKIYFWMALFITLVVLFGIYPSFIPLHTADYFWIIVSFPHFTGLYAYAYKKRVLTTTFWKYYFLTVFFGDIVTVFYYFTSFQERYPLPLELQSQLLSSDFNLLLAFLIESPFLYAFYKLGFVKNSHKKTTFGVV
jgi:hypothetical protein